MACFRVFRQQQDGYDGGSRREMEDRSRSASPPVAVTNREFQGIAVNDQDLPETITKTTRGIADLVEKSADLDHESVADEPLEKEFACHIATDFDDGDPADDDDEEISAAQMKNKLEQFFADDPLTEAIDALDVLTLEEAAIYLKIEYADIRRMVKEQGLPGRKIGEEWRFLRGAIADWLRAASGSSLPATQPEKATRAERPARDDRPQRRFPEEQREQQRESNEGFPQRSQPPRPRPQFRSQNQFGGGAETSGYQGGQHQGGQAGGNAGSVGQGGYPPPRRRRYEGDQSQQPPQGDFRPPRKRPSSENVGGHETSTGFRGRSGHGGPAGGSPFVAASKKPKRDALENQRFKRLDRRRFGSDQPD